LYTLKEDCRFHHTRAICRTKCFPRHKCFGRQ